MRTLDSWVDFSTWQLERLAQLMSWKVMQATTNFMPFKMRAKNQFLRFSWPRPLCKLNLQTLKS